MVETKQEDVVDKIVGKKDSYYLNPKQRRFVDEYLIDLNASRAYRAAGYSSNNTKGIAGAAWGLLRKPAVQRIIKKQMEERRQRCHVDADRVIKELAKIAFATIKDVIRWNETGVTLKPSDEILNEDAAAIAEVQVNFTEYGANLRVKMYDKRAALVDLGNHLGIFEKKDPQKNPVEEAQKICSIVGEMISTMTGTNPIPQVKTNAG